VPPILILTQSPISGPETGALPTAEAGQYGLDSLQMGLFRPLGGASACAGHT